MPRNCNDIMLIVSGKKFMANKAILSEESDYFKAMFSSGMIESNSNEVVINGISLEGFRDILKYMNGLEVEICMDNVLDILEIAHYIQINHAVEFCEEFLILNVDTKNCGIIANIADFYSFVDLKEHVINFIDENLWDISKTESFYKLTPEQIHHAVTADKEVKFSELNLLEAVLQWGLKPSDLTIEEKLRHVEDMLDHVRFYEIPKKELNQKLEIMSSINSAIHPIHEKITQLSMLPCNLLRTKFSTRGLKNAILKVGGFSMKGKKLSIMFNFIEDFKWMKLTTIPTIDELYPYCRTAVLKNKLYMIGNYLNEDARDAQSCTWKFSSKTITWEATEPMNLQRWRFSICEVDDEIYVVGGSIKADQSMLDLIEYEYEYRMIEFEVTNTAERYDPITETWKFIGSLPQPRESHASVNCANTLYISGGISNSRMEDSMMKYHPSTKTWLSCAPLLSPRTDHVMISYGDKIYVCGGWSGNPNWTHLMRQVFEIEEYDVATDSWRFLTTIPSPHPPSGAFFVESKIYILADRYDTDPSDNDMYEIDCYDVVTNEWSKELKEKRNSTDTWNSDCITMYLPKSLAGS